MDREVFVREIRSSLDEINARHPDYLNMFGVSMKSFTEIARRVKNLPLFQQCSERDLETSLVRGAQALEDLGLSISLDGERTDAVSNTLMLSILDAYAAAIGELSTGSRSARSFSLSNPDAWRSHAVTGEINGIGYISSNCSARPLLIISTTGAPASIWAAAFADGWWNRRCLIVESRCGPLMQGGTPRRSSLLEDARDIAAVLSALDIEGVDVLAWCNGARVAVELARTNPRLVGSLVLVAPTFRTASEAASYPSPFEEGLFSMHRMLCGDSARGVHLLEVAVSDIRPDLARFWNEVDKGAEEVLRLTPAAYKRALLLPLMDADHFKNYIDRVRTDEEYDIRSAVASASCPIFLIVGTHDAAINTDCVIDVLRQSGRSVIRATVFGAGHHIHLLQPEYLKRILAEIESSGQPASTARVSVERPCA